MNALISELQLAVDNLKTLYTIEEEVKKHGANIISMESVEGLAPGSLPDWAPIETFTATPSCAGIDDASNAIKKAKRAMLKNIAKIGFSLRKDC